MRNFMKIASAALLAFSLPFAVLADDIAITNARIHTMGPAGTIENGTVLVEGKTIRAVGANVSIPDGFRVIDADGRNVTPGLFASRTMLGLTEISLEASTTDYAPDGEFGGSPNAEFPFGAAYDVSFAINPNSTLIPVQRIEGVTRALTIPGSGDSFFMGQAAIINLGGGYDMVDRPRAAMVVDLGQGGANMAGGSRAGAVQILTMSLQEAADFARRGDRSLPGRERDSLLSIHDAEALAPVVNGDVPLFLSVDRATDILQALSISDRFPRLRLVLVGVAEGWMVADQIAAASVPVIVFPEDNLPASFDAIGATLMNAARLAEAGVEIAISGESDHNARLLSQYAGNAVAVGLDWGTAMAAITINPARMLGVGNMMGSLEAGKVADVVVWDGDPLEVTTNADMVFINGSEIEMVSRQTRLRDRYLNLDAEWPPAYRK